MFCLQKTTQNNMAKILLLSTIYPAPDIKIANNTNVVHYFAREWVRQRHEVLVIHNYPVYMRLFHWIGGIAEKTIASKFNTSVTSAYQNRIVEYEMDGVKVIRMPFYKPLPRFAVPQKYISKQVERIAEYCNKYDFIPDVISAHNYYPHVPIVNNLKEKYFPDTKTCIVIHKQVWKMLKYCGEDYRKELEKINIWGFRSLPLKHEFENHTGFTPTNYFMCYSGIPPIYLQNNQLCDIRKPIVRFVYVGSFIQRKYPEKILLAIKESGIKDFKLDYVGDGVNRKMIEMIVKENGWDDKVTLHGFVNRDQVPNFIAAAQCFIMISEEETFGLVYLEAMSKGCLTIASRGEGMEGIIEDAVNGFLCEAGNEHELATIINRINMMSEEELLKISSNARNTAMRLTDDNVAKIYATHLIENRK